MMVWNIRGKKRHMKKRHEYGKKRHMKKRHEMERNGI